jgi:hypothetical protein
MALIRMFADVRLAGFHPPDGEKPEGADNQTYVDENKERDADGAEGDGQTWKQMYRRQTYG